MYVPFVKEIGFWEKILLFKWINLLLMGVIVNKNYSNKERIDNDLQF